MPFWYCSYYDPDTDNDTDTDADVQSYCYTVIYRTVLLPHRLLLLSTIDTIISCSHFEWY